MNMMLKLAAISATTSLVAAPVSATEMQVPSTALVATVPGVFDVHAVNAHNHRYGWDRGGWYRRNRVDAGDVIGAVLVLGTIAAVANAATRAATPRYRYPDIRYPQPYPQRPYDYRSRVDAPVTPAEGGISGAIDRCVRAVEPERRIDTIESAQREGSGWRVAGRLQGGEPFACMIGADGRIETTSGGVGSRQLGSAVDRQWSDERYNTARVSQDGSAALPPYPGGPLPGEPIAPDGTRISG